MIYTIGKIICLVFGHNIQPGYYENYEPKYCSTCGLNNPVRKSRCLGVHKLFDKLRRFVYNNSYE